MNVSPEVIEQIMCELATGDSLKRISERCGVPVKVIWKAIFGDPKLKEQYEFALMVRAQLFAEDALAIADDPTVKGHDKQIQISTRLKLAEKYDPARFGEKPPQAQAVTVNLVGITRTVVEPPSRVVAVQGPDDAVH